MAQFQTTTAQNTPDVRICVLQRSWVLVGIYKRTPHQCALTHAFVVRRWGTEQGLGQIANGGPTDKTILDAQPPTNWHPLAEVQRIECNPDAWRETLEGHPFPKSYQSQWNMAENGEVR